MREPAAQEELYHPQPADKSESTRAAACQHGSAAAECEHGQTGRQPDQLAGENAAQWRQAGVDKWRVDLKDNAGQGDDHQDDAQTLEDHFP